MPDRSVTVRLIAITAQYDEAMKQSGKVTTDLGTAAEVTGTKSAKASKDVDGLAKSLDDAGIKANKAKASFSPLGLAIVGIGPALVPLTGLAVGAAGALAGMGVAGMLAFKGIQDQMTDGTDLGKTYTGQLALLSQSFDALSRTAAAGVLGPFEAAVQDLQKQVPFLNTSVGTFSTILGKTGVDVEQGLVASLHSLMPLFTDVGLYVEDLAKRFDTFASGGGLQRFDQWAQAELPQIERFLHDVASAIEHIIQASAGLGGAAISELGLVARAINDLPLPVLEALIPLLVNGYLAFKAYQGLSVLTATLGALSAKLTATAVATEGSAIAARTATGAYLGLEAAAGPIGIALAVAGTAMSLFGGNTSDATQQVETFKQALIDSKGAIDDSVLSATALQLQQSGLADKAQKAGISLRDLTAGATGTDAQFGQLIKTWQATGDPSAMTLMHLLGMRGEFEKGQASATQYMNAMKPIPGTLNGIAGASLAVSNQIAELGQKYGATAAQVQAFATQNNVTLDGTDKTSKSFTTLADKAVLAGSSVKALADDAVALSSPFLKAADAVKTFTDALAQESALAGGDVVRSHDALQKSLNALAQTLHDGKGAFDQFSDAGLTSRSAVDSAASAAGTYAAQIFKQESATKGAATAIHDAIGAYTEWYNALVVTAKAQGLSKQALDDYLGSVGELPSQVAAALSGTSAVGQNAGTALVAGFVNGVDGSSASATTAAMRMAAQLDQARQGFYQEGLAAGDDYVAALNFAMSNGAFGPQHFQHPTGNGVFAPNSQAPKPVTFNPGAPNRFSTGSFGAGSLKATGGSTTNPVVTHDDLLSAQALAAIDPTNKLALAQEAVTDAVRRLNNETKKGSLEYYQDLQKLHAAQAALAAEVKAEADARAQAAKQLATDVASENDLLAQEAATTKQFYADLAKAAEAHAAKDAQLLADRTTAIENFASATTKATIQWGSSLSWLSGNVTDQTNQITQWAAALADARKRGVSEAVISALGLDQGPQALGQLQQFSSATKAQIDQLNQAVAAKNAAAGKEAHTEAVNSYGQLGKDLLAEQQSYADAVIALQTKFASDMAALAKQVQQAQLTVSGDQATLKALPGGPTSAGPAKAATYHLIPNPAAERALPAGTQLFTKDSHGGYDPIANPTALGKLPKGTPIYDRTYDSGGALLPGFTVAYNGTGKTEHVFTSEQLAAMAGGGEVTVVAQVVLDGKVIDQQITKHNAAKRQQILVGGVRP